MFYQATSHFVSRFLERLPRRRSKHCSVADDQYVACRRWQLCFGDVWEAKYGERKARRYPGVHLPSLSTTSNASLLDLMMLLDIIVFSFAMTQGSSIMGLVLSTSCLISCSLLLFFSPFRTHFLHGLTIISRVSAICHDLSRHIHAKK